jgi:beta-galactosidase
MAGLIDAVRLPKEVYFAERAMQNEKSDIHIIGHWTYPANTTKTMYVVANHVDSVELFVNGASRGKVTQPESGYLYTFPNVAFAPGEIKAVGYRGGASVTQHELKTAGAPAAMKLTLHTAPGGLRADGEDIALIDFEVVDANGERCPTDDGRVDFTWSSTGRAVSATGPAIWRGGYNSGKTNSTNNLYLNTEDGINRVAMRSTLMPGTFTVTATREGLKPATITIESKAVAMTDGLSQEVPQRLSPAAQAEGK